jgi:hypothetical protein
MRASGFMPSPLMVARLGASSGRHCDARPLNFARNIWLRYLAMNWQYQPMVKVFGLQNYLKVIRREHSKNW